MFAPGRVEPTVEDVLREELAGQPESLEAVEQMYQSTLLLLQRVNEALDAARLQAGAPVRTGAGSGPLNHGWQPLAMKRVPL